MKRPSDIKILKDHVENSRIQVTADSARRERDCERPLAMSKPDLSPFVYWAQTETTVGLRVDLKDVKSPQIKFDEDDIKVKAVGVGARGVNEYCFSLEFFLSIDPKKSHYKVLDREIEITLTKKKHQWWPRLIADQKKPVWLKIDFDKWKTEDDEEELPNNIEQQIRDIYDPKREEAMQDEAYRKIYLFMYNIFMFGGFLCILGILLFFLVKDGQAGISRAYERVGGLVIFFQVFQVFEIIFAVIGWSKSKNLLPMYFQIFGRLFILFFMIMAESRIQTHRAVFYLFMIWSIAEIFRYPYYFLAIFDIKVDLITWLRYTMWIPLYPAGVLSEAIIVFNDIPYFEETKLFSYSLPNALNWSFDLPTLMRIYLLFACFPLLSLFMFHMYKQRRSRIGKTKPKTKTE